MPVLLSFNQFTEVLDNRGRQTLGDVAVQIKVEFEEYLLGSSYDSVANTNKTKATYLSQAFHLSSLRTNLILLHSGSPTLKVLI